MTELEQLEEYLDSRPLEDARLAAWVLLALAVAIFAIALIVVWGLAQ